MISCSPLDAADTRGMARVHECADCGAKFSDGDVLDDHIVQVHLDGKPYDGEGDNVSNSASMDGTSIKEETSDEESSDDEGEADDEDSDGLVTANSGVRHTCWRRYCSKASPQSFCQERHVRHPYRKSAANIVVTPATIATGHRISQIERFFEQVRQAHNSGRFYTR